MCVCVIFQQCCLASPPTGMEWPLHIQHGGLTFHLNPISFASFNLGMMVLSVLRRLLTNPSPAWKIRMRHVASTCFGKGNGLKPPRVRVLSLKTMPHHPPALGLQQIVDKGSFAILPVANPLNKRQLVGKIPNPA